MWNIKATVVVGLPWPNIFPSVFGVSSLIHYVAHNIYHKQYNSWGVFTCGKMGTSIYGPFAQFSTKFGCPIIQFETKWWKFITMHSTRQ